MLLIDTNVLVDIVTNDVAWAEWSIAQLRAQSQIHQLFINPVIYSEFSLAFESVAAVDERIDAMNVGYCEVPKPALFLAARAFVKYRRAGGSKESVLPDFIIGAHAAVLRCGVLTRDPRRYSTYFPTVPLVTPRLS